MFPVDEPDLISLFKTGGPSRVPISDTSPAIQKPAMPVSPVPAANGQPVRPIGNGAPVIESKGGVWGPGAPISPLVGPAPVNIVPGLPSPPMSLPPGISTISGIAPSIAGQQQQAYSFEIDDGISCTIIPINMI